MVVWINRPMIVLRQEFCYIKDVIIYIVTLKINNNVATEIKHLQKNMVADPRESRPLCSSENTAFPLDSKSLSAFEI